MATIVNNPPASTTNDSGSGFGFVLGVLLLLVFAILFFVYALPLFQKSAAPQVTVPDKVDVNINQPSGQ